MFRLGELREGLAAYAASFDPALITAEEAASVVREAAAIEKMAGAVKALAAARVAETAVWQRGGDPTPAHYLARASGTSVGAAKETLEAGKRLPALPKVATAARQGRLSAQQVAAVADAASADPGAEERLVEQATGGASLGELKEECARTKAAALPDQQARHQAAHARRCARRRRLNEVEGEIIYRTTLDEIAEVWAVLQGYATAAFKTARAEGRREPPEAYAADGMLAMARAAAAPAAPTPAAGGAAAADASPAAKPKPAPAKIVVRIDWDALLRGFPIEGEVCEIAGIGPVPVGVVRTMMATGDAFLAAVVTKGVDVVTVAHLGRRATVYQQTGLDWLSPGCSREGCNRTDGLEVDHRADWAETKITLLRFLDRLCDHDHDLKTRHGWALVDGVGKRPMVPPDHPQHPNNANPNAPPGQAGAA